MSFVSKLLLLIVSRLRFEMSIVDRIVGRSLKIYLVGAAFISSSTPRPVTPRSTTATYYPIGNPTSLDVTIVCKAWVWCQNERELSWTEVYSFKPTGWGEKREGKRTRATENQRVAAFWRNVIGVIMWGVCDWPCVCAPQAGWLLSALGVSGKQPCLPGLVLHINWNSHH